MNNSPAFSLPLTVSVNKPSVALRSISSRAGLHVSRRKSRPLSVVVPTMSLAEGVWSVNAVPKTQASGKKVAIIGAGLAGLITAMELADAGCEVSLYDTRSFAGGKVGSWQDSKGNHIEMGLHVFFGCYYNLFDVMQKVGSFQHLLQKEHVHQFVNTGGKIGSLDFRMGAVGAPFNGLKAFAATSQLPIADKLSNALALGTSVIVRGLVDFDGAMRDIRNLDSLSFSDWFISKGGSRGSIQRMWDPIAYALGFIDCDHMSARCMLTIFQLFAARSEASVLRMLEGSPDKFLTGPIVKYIEDRGAKLNLGRAIRNILWEEDTDGRVRVTGLDVAKGATTELAQADYYIAACDVAGAQRIIPTAWRHRFPEFDRMFALKAVPVVTVQLRFDGWVTELADGTRMKVRADGQKAGIDNLLYTADADFSCFADLAVTSPTDYYREGEGSLLQCVLTPGDPYMPKSNAEIVEAVKNQVLKLFPSSECLTCTWSSVVKLGESLYREEPGMDLYRPKQKTSIDNFFLAGSYTFQDYIDSMEGAVKSGRLAAKEVLESVRANSVS